jgi:hypothetical protein
LIIHKEENNVYATNIEGDVLHVSDAKSGKQGYYCLGCQRELQAVKSKLANRISYFRHDPKATKGKGKCTFSDETHRHKIAKEILQRIKRIKVPPLYKYPPKKGNGQANLLSKAKFIEAYSVENERYFYENEDGKILWGLRPEVSDKYLLIKPDVTFFNKEYEPILFIEIVATNKVSEEKKVKLKRLGVDTISIRVPKGSPEEIEESLLQTVNTKWIYNYEQECTEYIPVPESNSEGIPPIDEEQRKLFEETYSCRSSQINNLIRTIKRCLESKPYADIERAIRDELSRVEKNTDRDKERLQRLEGTLRKRIDRKHREHFEQLKLEEEEFELEESEFQQRFEDLEQRYKSKRDKLEIEEATVEFELKGEVEGDGNRRKTFDERENEIKQATKEAEQLVRLEEESIRNIERETEELPEKYRKIEQELRQRFEHYEEYEKNEIGKFQSEEKALRGRFESEREELESKFEELRRQSLKQFEKRDFGIDSQFSRELKKTITYRESVNNLNKDVISIARIRRAREYIRNGAYKNWYD